MENARISLAQIRGRASGLLKLVLKLQKQSWSHNLKGRCKMLSKSLHLLNHVYLDFIWLAPTTVES